MWLTSHARRPVPTDTVRYQLGQIQGTAGGTGEDGHMWFGAGSKGAQGNRTGAGRDEHVTRVEWLELRTSTEPEPDPYGTGLDAGPATGTGRGRLPRWWPVAALVAAALVVASIVQHTRTPKAPAVLATPSHPPVSTSPTTTSPAPSTSHTPPAVSVRRIGPHLLGVTAGWQLVARGQDSVVRVELAKGRVTTTAIPTLNSGGTVSFIVTRDRVIVRPWDPVIGYSIADSGPVRTLTGPLHTGGGPVFPGPDATHLWRQPDLGAGTAQLVGLDGRPTPTTITLPSSAYISSGDGAGYLLVGGLGGVYDARPFGLRRITTGAVSAIGSTSWLTAECDETYHCATVLIDRVTGERRVLNTPPIGNLGPPGVISPDGRMAALDDYSTDGAVSARLVDLTTGAERTLKVAQSTDGNPGTMVWSPDSRWLFVANIDSGISVVDARTGATRTLLPNLPNLSQLAIRPAATG